MKQLLNIFAATLLAIPAMAQQLDNYKEKLLSPVQADSTRIIWNTVHTAEYGDAAQIVASERPMADVNGFRIVTFVSNTPSARQDALNVKLACDSLYVSERSYLTYENPYFKVSVGNCTTQEEAIVLLENIRRTYPKAFVVRTTIPLKEFHRKPAPAPQAPAETPAEAAAAESESTLPTINDAQRKELIRGLLQRL